MELLSKQNSAEDFDTFSGNTTDECIYKQMNEVQYCK